jgi:hypothetical protein
MEQIDFLIFAVETNLYEHQKTDSQFIDFR